MESLAACNLCRTPAARSQPFLTGRDRMHGQPGTFQLVGCPVCGLIYLNPRPEAAEMARFYPDTYASYRDAPATRGGLRRVDETRGIALQCAAVTRPFGKPGRVLDVGCATGAFLDGMRARGWAVAGVERSGYAAGYARDVLGLDVREGVLEAAGFPDAAFDLVTLWHVFEHVDDPTATLREVWRILAPGGWLALTVPQVESPEARMFGRYWLGWDVPRHLFLYRRPVLRRYLTEAGFEQIALSCVTGRSIGVPLSVAFWATDWPVPDVVRRIGVGLAGSLPVRMMLWPYYWLLGRLGWGSFVTAMARKP